MEEHLVRCASFISINLIKQTMTGMDQILKKQPTKKSVSASMPVAQWNPPLLLNLLK